jgi:Protein of unknown function (DUF5132)
VARHNSAQGKVAPAATDHVTVVGGSRISIQGDKLQDIFRTVADRRLANNRRFRALRFDSPPREKTARTERFRPWPVDYGGADVEGENRMALLDDAFKGGGIVMGIAAGVGAALVAPVLIPALRPIAKSILKAGLMAYDQGRVALAELNEQTGDILAEARAELEQGAKAATGEKPV